MKNEQRCYFDARIKLYLTLSQFACVCHFGFGFDKRRNLEKSVVETAMAKAQFMVVLSRRFDKSLIFYDSIHIDIRISYK
jgi:hypothetical protein